MDWKPKQQALVTSDEVAHAKSLLPPNAAWHVGLIEETDSIQYRGAMHPNASGVGTHPGVEVWTNVPADQVGAKPMAEDLGTSSPAEIEAVLSAVEAVGYPRDEVYSTIMIESGWKPHNYFHHPDVPPEKAAGGLIGFMPFVLKDLGWTQGAIAFRALSTGEQAPWVAKYFDRAPPWKYPGDTYVATAAGGYVGKANDVVVYKAGTPQYDLNKGWDLDKDGQVTVGDLRSFLLLHLRKPPTGGGGPTPAPKDPTTVPAGSSVSVYLEQLLSALQRDAEHKRYPKFGIEADSVIRSYQKARGLKVDGDVGPLTLAQLEKELT